MSTIIGLVMLSITVPLLAAIVDSGKRIQTFFFVLFCEAWIVGVIYLLTPAELGL